MKDSLGGSLLLNLVVIFSGVIVVFFISVLSYSKAYRVKNRIIEIIEKYGVYVKLDENSQNLVTQELNPDLSAAGYDSSSPSRCDKIKTSLVSGDYAKYDAGRLSDNLNFYGYNYCVFEMCNEKNADGMCIDSNGKYYVVATFTQFEFPIIGDIIKIPVYGETKTLEKTYDY